MSFTAEEAYLFAHATLREAAYQLWLPSDRARLHAFALELLEALPEAALERMAAELADHAHAAQQGVDSQRDAALLAKLRSKELSHLVRAAREANKRYQRDRVVEYCSRALAAPEITDQLAMDFEGTLATEHFVSGKLDSAQTHFERQRELALKHGNGSAAAGALLNLGRVFAGRGKTAEAERYYNESFQMAQSHSDKALMASALSWLAGIFEDTGRGHLSEEMQHRAVRLATESGVESMRLATTGNLANHYRHTGKLDECALHMRAVLSGYEAIGDERHVCVALNNLGRTLLLQGKLDEADACFSRALELQKPMGQVFSQAFSLGNVAEVWLARGKTSEAIGALRKAISICEESASLMHGAAYKSSLASALLLLGDRDQAQETIEDARTDFIQSGGALYIPDYCDLVRMRIAADAATDSAALAGRKTAKINALAPRASWLPIMRQILQGMKKSLSAQKAGAFELKRGIALGESLLAEIETAVQENRPALVFHGFLPSELSIELRGALLQILARTSTSEVLRFHAALDSAMRIGVSLQSK